MDLEQLNKIDTSNVAQVKALQTFLKTRGYYNGPIDGKWGGGTTEGAVKLRTDLTNAANTNRDTAVANREANDPTNNAIRGATEIGPYVGGMAVGAGVGHAIGSGLKAQDTAQRTSIKSIAADPRITTDAANAQMRSMRTARNAVSAAQFAVPGLFLGSAEYMRRGIAPGYEDPVTHKDTETSKWLKLGANLDQGVGFGVLGHQLVGLRKRIPSPNDSVDEALIASRGLPSSPLPAAPRPASALPPPDVPVLRPNSDRLIAAARAAGATGKLTKASAQDYLTNNISDANRSAIAAELGVKSGPNFATRVSTAIKNMASSRGASSLIGPLVAGGVAYDAATNDAEAAGATPGEARTRGAVAGTGAAAMTGGAVYGLNKLAQAAPAVGRVLGAGLNALSAAGAAYDNAAEARGYRNAMPPEQRDSPTGMLLPHAMPLAMRGASDIAAIASAPGRLQRAVSSALTPGNATPEETQGAIYPEAVPPQNALAAAGRDTMPKTGGPLFKAAALNIPDNIPPNAARDAEMQAAFGGGRFPEQNTGPAGGTAPSMDGNPLAQAGNVKDKFGQALDAFMAFLAEEQAAQQQPDEAYAGR